MNEATKTNNVRTETFKRAYFSGRVIDIGCGPDPVVPHAVPFDLEHGDAQRILDYFLPETFDCVHSSHCLEHMRNVKAALSQWWALAKPGGHLVIVVPHERLYEQNAWPSLFNRDHKATFNLGTQNPASAVSYDLAVLIEELPGARIVEAVVQDHGLDYALLRRITRWGRALYQMAAVRRWLLRRLIKKDPAIRRFDIFLDRLERRLGKPVDQTLGDALAQIQVVATKFGVPLAH